MTALGTPVQPQQARAPRRGGAWMRRIGGVAVTMALVVLGLGAGLWLGSPASAATGSIEVDMGDGSGYVTGTATKLLDMSALAPGGSVSGDMKVRDASGNDAASPVAVVLMAVGVTYGDTCALTKAECLAASTALAGKLSFDISSTAEAGSLGHGIPSTGVTLKMLTEDGVVIGDGMVDPDTLEVTVTASLDFGSTGNEVQYGSVTFNLALGLMPSEPGSDGDPGTGDTTETVGGDTGPVVVGGGGAGTPGAPEVASENQELPPDQVVNQGPGVAEDDIIVLGESKSELPNTGVPVVSMLTVGGGVLLVGLALLYAARRRSRTTG